MVVGSDRKHFIVHKNEICARSDFFKAVCSELWNKSAATTKTVELCEEDEHIFDILLHCIYKDKVDFGDLSVAIPGEAELDKCDWIEHRLVKAYILVDKLRDVVSANMFMDHLIEYYLEYDWMAALPLVNIVANKTASESPLRKVVVDLTVRQARTADIREVSELESLPKQFVCELLAEAAGLWNTNERKLVKDVFNGDFLSKQPKCRYHQHDELHPVCGESCEAKEMSKAGSKHRF